MGHRSGHDTPTEEMGLGDASSHMLSSEMMPDKRRAAANLAAGWQRLIGPTLGVYIVVFFYVLFEPLLITRIAFIRQSEIVLARVAYDLYATDTFLFVIVFGFGIVTPIVKMIASVVIWYFVDIRRAKRYALWLVLLGKLSMLDVLLLAVLVIAIKGIGLGAVEIRLGLYVYGALVIGSFLTSLLSEHLIERFAASEDAMLLRQD